MTLLDQVVRLQFYQQRSSSSISTLMVQDIRAYLDSVLTSPVVDNIVMLIKAVSLMACAALVMGIIYLIIRMNLVGMKIRAVRQVVHPQDIAKNKQIAARLKKITARLARQNPEEDRRAVIEASQLFERALEALGHTGKSFEDLVSDIPIWKSVSVDEIVSARASRVQLVHRPGMQFSHADAEQTVDVFQRALSDLGMV